MNDLRSRLLRAGTAVAVASTAVLVPATVAAPPAAASVLSVGSYSKITITARGRGHGYGMSQWGAKGAALAGKTYKTILAFYYPGTTQTRLRSSVVRVRLSKKSSKTTVAAATGLTITGLGLRLPSTGIARYRLAADAASGLTLQKLPVGTGATWQTVRTGLANRTAFYQPRGGVVRVFDTAGTSTSYFGLVSAVRSVKVGKAKGVKTVNRVPLDLYAAGVVGREMPVSWPKQAVYSQAVAARTYGRFAVENARKGSEYDLCDTNRCQVYGGHARYNAAGKIILRDYVPAARATSNTVLRYRGKTIFAQFDGSNGGWVAAHDKPYLKARVDTWDRARGTNPNYRFARTISVKQVASYYHLKKLTQIVVSKRDGHGEWGGRMLSGYVRGVNSKGKPVTIATSPYSLWTALGIATAWFTLKVKR